jgi:hypothetical protein
MAYPGFIEGWVNPNDGTSDQQAAHAAALAKFEQLPAYAYQAEVDRPKKVVLNGIWNHPEVVKALGFRFPRIKQITGSCVWAGGMNAFFTRAAIDAILLRQPERLAVPFGLNNYGSSRRRAGMLLPGSGSFGSSFAASLIEDGVTYADSLPGLPQWSQDDGIVYGGSVELRWSVTSAIPAELAALAKNHVVTGVNQIKSVQELIDAIQVRKNPCTFACGRYIDNGVLSGSGTDTVVMGKLDSRGGHQTSLLGFWDHPRFGPLVKNQNSWPSSVYPTDPDTEHGTPCAVWQSVDDLDKYLGSGGTECYELGGYNGFEAQTFSW